MKPETVLFVSPLLAMPQQHGGCVYPNAVLHALHAAGWAIDYVWLAWPLREGRVLMRDPLRAPYVRRGFIPGTFRFGKWRTRRLTEWWRRTPATAGSNRSDETLPGLDEQTFLRDLIRRTGARTVLVDFADTLPVLDGLPPSERAQIKVAVLTHNLNSRRTELYRTHSQPLDFRPTTVAEETTLLARADIVVAIQEREAEAFRAMLPLHSVVTVPLPVRPEPIPAAQDGAPICLFVGGYSGHNLAGLSWLLRDVWPLVMKELPEARLHVAGTVGQGVPAGTAGVCTLGPVDALRDVYAVARVALAPLPMGTGLKIKVIEAMGWGRPVVATAAGGEGFAEMERGEVVVVEDTPEGFAAAILRLLRTPEQWQRVVARELAWIAKTCTPTRAIAPLLEAWDRPKTVSHSIQERPLAPAAR